MPAPFASVALNILYGVRGPELYLENWCRQDVILFSKPLGPIQEGSTTSSPTHLISPFLTGS